MNTAKIANTCGNILIVEDDEDIRYLLKISLELEGYTVFDAENGQIALEILQNIPRPCIILLDLMMPVMDGWAFVERLEKDISLATIPVVVVSAFTELQKPIKSKGFIKKPIDLKILIEVVKKWCSLENGNNVKTTSVQKDVK